MKRLIYLLLPMSFAACNPDTVDLSGSSGRESTRSYNSGELMSLPDSIARLGVATAPLEYVTLGSSSTLGVSVTVPVIADDFVEPTGLVPQFKELARLTGGEMHSVDFARQITQTFINILDSHLVDNADVVFMIDGTASMFDDIDNVKRGITTLMKHVQTKKNVRVGVAVYRDVSDGSYWYDHLQLTTDYDAVVTYVNGISALGGGPDWPESVYDGAMKTMDTMEWRTQSAKMMLVLGDAPALVGPRTTYSLEDVVVRSKQSGVDMNFYPVLITTFIQEDLTFTPVTPPKPMISKMYPNPTAGDVTVELNETEEYTWQVTDIAGGVLMEGNDYSNRFKIDLSSLPNGVYMVKISKTSAVESKMIVVSH